MEASTILWKQWQEQVKDLLPSIHGHQKKTLALSVLGIVLSKSAVLQRMAESIYVHGISQAKMVSIERRFARFVANERLDVRSIWTELLKQLLMTARPSCTWGCWCIRGCYRWRGGSCPTRRNGTRVSGSW